MGLQFYSAAFVAVGRIEGLDRLRQLPETAFPAGGSHAVTWNGRDTTGAPVASGIYFYQFAWAGQTQWRRLVLVR